MIKYLIQKPSIEEYFLLRNSVGWSLDKINLSLERAIDSLNKSPFCVCAYERGKIIGMVRLVGDLSMYGYIQDTIVLPEYQGRGIGKNLILKILKKVRLNKGYLLGVCPSKVSVSFYEKFGFKKRPENPNGFMSLEF